jgi:alanine racemase
VTDLGGRDLGRGVLADATPPRAAARVDLEAIASNVRALDAASPNAGVMAVVKADGYGHGLVPSARAAVAGGASWLGVALPEEAIALRAAGLEVPILSWLLPPDDPRVWRDAIAHGIDVSLNSIDGLARVTDAVSATGTPARVHLKIDTGLSRGGATRAEWTRFVDAVAQAQAAGTLEVVGIWSHLAFADEPNHPVVQQQIDVFTAAVHDAQQRGVQPQVRHLANSGATLMNPAAHFDLVRPGIAVYGLSPGDGVGDVTARGLTPAMTLTARVMLAKDVPAGSGVSYAHTYLTERDTRLALVPLGYADGIPRAASSLGPVTIDGERFAIAGRVCMDQFVVDVGDAAVDIGDEVVLFGAAERGEPTADEWAALTGTIGYEIVTRIGPRVPRLYTGGAGWD